MAARLCDVSGTAEAEYIMIVAGFALPLFFAVVLAVLMLDQYYTNLSWIVSLPFP